LGDVIQLAVFNDPTNYSSSVIQISASVPGPTNIPLGAILIPGAIAVIPWSGSLTSVAARVIGSYPPFASGSFLQAGLGNIQYLAQQS
jgi:hypothetical protein